MDHQSHLMEFWNTDLGRRYGKHFSENLRRKNTGAGQESNEGAFAYHLNAMLGAAEPMYVDSDVLDLIDAARSTFEPEALMATDAFVPWGFAYFERPVYVTDVRGKQTAFRAMAWAPYVYQQVKPLERVSRAYVRQITDDPEAASGLLLATYAHHDDRDDYWERHQEQRAQWGRWPLTLAHYTPWTYGQEWMNQVDHENVEKRGYDVANVIAQAKEFSALGQVFFRLMQQKVITTDRHDVDRGARRRHDRAGGKHKRVIVVTLRRPKNPQRGDGGPMHYSHRFIVSGHWRNQWYPSIGAHRQKWIAEYVKGDGELIVRNRAFEFTR